MTTNLTEWQQRNDAYLTLGLRWLRVRLGTLAAREDAATADEEEAAASMRLAEATDPPPALIALAERLGLSQFEQQLLLLSVAMELDTGMPLLCAQAQGDPSKAYPTFALALAAMEHPSWDALSPHRPLRYWRLIEIYQPAAAPLTGSALRADERITNFVKGLNELDDRLASVLTPLVLEDATVPESQHAVGVAILRQLQIGAQGRTAPLVQLLGPDTGSKRLIAASVAETIGLDLYHLSFADLPTSPAEIDQFTRLWERETLLTPVALYLEAHDLPPEQETTHPAVRFLEHVRSLVFVATHDGLHLSSLRRESSRQFDVQPPTPAEQRAEWSVTLAERSVELPTRLAGQFDLDIPSIRQIAALATTDTEPGGEIDPHVWKHCLHETRPRIESLAQRLDPKATWDDIVLPTEIIALLRQVADQTRYRSAVYDDWGFRARMNRGLGLSVLFAGSSGTGKTMAAEVLANDLQLDLYRIDLSAAVSKYIGETEKNLRRLFEAAERGGAILFFDEADALFGKRSEVKDSHDRYANIEVNYLLQRMESYRGLAILATNMKSALDEAFLRRLRFVVNFPFPNSAERKRIWRNAFPAQTPLDGVEFERLARLELTGGVIHNIALGAAFIAAARSSACVSTAIVLEAARTEFRKLERSLAELELR